MELAPQTAHQRVMIVDDDRIIRQHIVDLVQREIPGLESVYEAIDGKHALEQLAQTQPGILFVDIRMPRMNGLEFVQEAQKRYPWMQFFILSNFDEFEMVKGAFKEGVLDYVLKYDLEPEDLPRLVAQGRAALEKALSQQKNERLLRCNALLAEMRKTFELLSDGKKAYALSNNCSAWFNILPPENFDAAWHTQVMLEIAGEWPQDRQDGVTMVYRHAGYSDTWLEIGIFTEKPGMRWSDAKHLVQKQVRTLSQLLSIRGLQHYGVYSNTYRQDGLRAEIARLQSAAEWIYYEEHSKLLPLQDAAPLTPLKERPEYSLYPLQCALLLKHGFLEDAADKLQETMNMLLKERPAPQSAKQVCYRYMVALQQQGIDIPHDNLVPDNLARSVSSLQTAFQLYHRKASVSCGNANIDNAVAYVTANISAPLHLSTVARISGYSKNHFSRIFRETMGATFSAFLNTTRIHLVSQLLLQGIPTDKAAFQVGFSDVRYFRLVFEKIMGMTVAQWREQKGETP